MKKPIFEECSKQNVKIPFVGYHKNETVNIALCTVLIKGSNTPVGHEAYYYIKFRGIKVTWIFISKESRDLEYSRLMIKYNLPR